MSFFSFVEKAANSIIARAEKRQELHLQFEREFSDKSQEQLLEIMRRSSEGSVQYLVAQKLFKERDFTLG